MKLWPVDYPPEHLEDCDDKCPRCGGPVGVYLYADRTTGTWCTECRLNPWEYEPDSEMRRDE